MTYVDLHMHTFYSDGTNEPRSLVQAVKLKGIDVMAITDHDTMVGYFEAKEEAEKWGIRLIPGVEVSTDRYHILGLNVDPTQRFNAFLSEIRENQKETCARRIELLQKAGMPISMEKLLKFQTHPDSRLGKYNLIYTILQDPECRQYIQDKHPGHLDVDEVFRIYVGKNSIADLESRKDVEFVRAIDEIHQAGGIAVIAHPFKEVKDLHAELDYLFQNGLDGLEIQPNYDLRNAPFAEYALYHDKFMTYGSDYHGPAFSRALLGTGNDNPMLHNNIEASELEKMLNKYRKVKKAA